MLPDATTQAEVAQRLSRAALLPTGAWADLPSLLRDADASFGTSPHDIPAAWRHAAFWYAAGAHAARSRLLALRSEAAAQKASAYSFMPAGAFLDPAEITRVLTDALGEIKAAATPETAGAVGQVIARLSMRAQPEAIAVAQKQDDSALARLRRGIDTAARVAGAVALGILGLGAAAAAYYAWTKRHAITGAIGSVSDSVRSMFARKRKNPRIGLRRRK